MTEKERILSGFRFPSTTDSCGRYRIWVPTENGRKQLYSRSINDLKNKVYKHMTGLTDDWESITFKEAFKQAQIFLKNNTNEYHYHSRLNTILKNDNTYARFFKNSDLESMKLNEITVQHIDAFLRDVLRENLVTQRTLFAIRDIINMVYKRARFFLQTDQNAAKDIIWRDYRHFLKEPAPIDQRVFSNIEMQNILEYIALYNKNSPAYIPAYALEFQFITGMRRGELPPLLWEDVDFENRRIYIHREQILTKENNMTRNIIVEHTKTGKARYYPIAEMEMLFLEKLYKVDQHYYNDSPFLFPYDSNNGCITNYVVYNFLYRICKKLGIQTSPECRRGTHALRRAAITETVNNSNGNVVLVA